MNTLSSRSTSYSTKPRNRGILAVFFAVAVLTPVTTWSQGINRSWTGASGGNWSDPNNWNPVGIPQSGDDLRFNTNTHTSMLNDIPNLTDVTLGFDNYNYTLAGNPIGLKSYTNDLSNWLVYVLTDGGGSPASATINCSLVLAPSSASIFGIDCLCGDSATLRLNADINLNGGFLYFQCYPAGCGGNATIEIAGSVSGEGTVICQACCPDGAIRFSGTADNTFTGPLWVEPLYPDFGSLPGSVSLDKQGGTVVTNRLVLSSYFGHAAGVIVDVDQPNQIGANASVGISGGSQLLLHGHNNTIGLLGLTNAPVDTNASLLDTGGGLLGLNGGVSAWNDSPGVVPTIKGILNLNGPLPFDIGGSSYAGLAVLASLASAGGISKIGPAALLLETNNSFGGAITVNQGIVDVRNNGALGPGPKNTVLAGGSLTLRNVSIGGNTLWASGQSIAGGMPGSLVTCVGSCSWSGPVLLDTNVVVVGDITLSGQVSGTGGIGFFGTGTSVLGGSVANPYTGTTLVRCPVVQLAKPVGVHAFSGPLVVGGGAGGPYEAVWVNAYQNPGAVLTLYANGVVNLNNNNEDFHEVTFNGGEVDTGTGQFGMYAPITVNPAPISAVINGYLGLAPTGDRVFIVGAGGSSCDLLVNAVVFGTPNGYFVKQGAGTMCLTGANTYNAVTLLEQGILDISNGSALGAVGCVIFNGATLRLEGTGSVLNNLEMVGAGLGGTHGAVEVAPGASINLNGNILLDAATTFNVGQGGGLGLNSVVYGTGPLFKSGPGYANLAGAANNTYTGDTIVSGGTLYLAKSQNTIAVPGNLVIGPSSSPAAAVLEHSGILGASVVTVNANGLFDLNGNNQILAQLNLNDGGSVQTGTGTLSFSSGGQVNVGSQDRRGSHRHSFITGNLGISPNDVIIFSVAPYASFFPFDFNPELDVPAIIPKPSDQPRFAPAGIIKTGSGEMRLRGNNTYQGSTQVNGGTLIAAAAGALGALLVAPVYVNTYGTLALDGGVVFEQSLYLNSSNSPALASWSGTNAWESVITLQQDTAIGVNANGLLQVDSAIIGNGSLTKIGPGTLQFSAFANNSYTGLTTVAEGLLESENILGRGIPGDASVGQDTTSGFNAALWLMTAQQMSPTANVTVNSSGFFELHDTPGIAAPTQQLQSVTGKGLLTIDSQAALILSNNNSFTFAGWLTGSGPLTKAGTGQFWLTDRSGNSTYTGPATVSGGDLRVDALVLGMSVDVKANARLRGGGAVSNVVVESVGQLAVDSAIPGRLGGTLAMRSLQLSNGSSVQLDLFGPSPTGGDEEIIATDPVVLNNANFVPNFRYPPREGDVITAIDKTAGGAASGTFAGWVQGQQRLVGTVPVAISYAGGDGNDVTLTVSNLALAFSSYRLAEGNGNQTVEPDECNLLYVSLVNRRTNAVSITNALLRAMTPGALVTIPQANYPGIAGGATVESSTPFQFRTDPSLPCSSGVSFELVLWTATEGQFAVDFTVVGGLDCTHPTGPCQSCAVVSGQFDSNSPVCLSPLYFVGGPSICSPPKPCPGLDPGTNLPPFASVVHPFANSSTNDLCLTAQLQFNCPAEPTNDLGVAAYLGGFDPNQPCSGYLGDLGLGGPPYPPFSFRVPAGSNFVLVVMARATNLVCNTYALELFGLPCPLPTLAIAPEAAPNKVRVQWSTAYPGWTAQQEGSLRGSFSNVMQLPAIIGGQYSLTNITTVTNQFYRLRK